MLQRAELQGPERLQKSPSRVLFAVKTAPFLLVSFPDTIARVLRILRIPPDSHSPGTYHREMTGQRSIAI